MEVRGSKLSLGMAFRRIIASWIPPLLLEPQQRQCCQQGSAHPSPCSPQLSISLLWYLKGSDTTKPQPLQSASEELWTLHCPYHLQRKNFPLACYGFYQAEGKGCLVSVLYPQPGLLTRYSQGDFTRIGEEPSFTHPRVNPDMNTEPDWKLCRHLVSDVTFPC